MGVKVVVGIFLRFLCGSVNVEHVYRLFVLCLSYNCVLLAIRSANLLVRATRLTDLPKPLLAFSFHGVFCRFLQKSIDNGLDV